MDHWLGLSPHAVGFNPACMHFCGRGKNAYGNGALEDMACHTMNPAEMVYLSFLIEDKIIHILWA